MAESGQVIVVAASARALVQSARAAGWIPSSIDLFADDDTVAASLRSVCVPATSDGLDHEAVLKALQALDPTATVPVVYGGVVDSQFELLERIQTTRTVLGTSVASLRKLQNPGWWSDCLSTAGIAHPSTRVTVPVNATGWLRKRTGGSGGSHVHFHASCAGSDAHGACASEDSGDAYFQHYLSGRSLSVTAVVDADCVRILGYADQTPAFAPTSFRFSGATAIDPTALQPGLRDSLDRVVATAASHMQLAGLVSFDFIVNEQTPASSTDQAACWLLEINARPSANFELFDSDGELFQLHMHAAISNRGQRRGEPTPHRLVDCTKTKLHRGFSVVYADRPVVTMANFDWPSWTSDRSSAGRHTATDEPLCTVHADADTPGMLDDLLVARQTQIKNMFYRSLNTHGVDSA